MFFEPPPTDTSKLTDEQRQLLLDQSIDENGPGTILQDFESLLTFIGVDGIQSNGKYRFFPMKSLGDINKTLTNPIQINLTRPQQKSYPNLHGLYLLLRCTGMIRVRAEGKKTWLVIDEQLHKGWMLLNPTEKYFTLLNAWLLHGSNEILEGSSGFFSDLPPLFKCVRFVESLKKSRMDSTTHKDLNSTLGYGIGLHHLALLELFGIVTILTDNSKNRREWRVVSVSSTTFGNAIMQLFSPFINQLSSSFDEVTVGTKNGTSPLMPVVQKFFPEWEKTNSVTTPENTFQDGIYVFKVTLGDVWGKIAVTGAMVFEDLSDAILAAFGFDHEHLYQFIYRNEFGIRKCIVHPHLDEDEPATTEISIGDLLLAPGDTMTYQYDFGDDWRFEILLEETHPLNDNLKDPEIIELYGKPPEQYTAVDDW